MEPTRLAVLPSAHWRIVHAYPEGGSLYALHLERGNGEAYATALVCVGNRAARGTHEPADWAVRVEWCPDDSAHAWLLEGEHEYAIGSLCVTGRVP